jgi:predicted XRE-type DNA-binding protein
LKKEDTSNIATRHPADAKPVRRSAKDAAVTTHADVWDALAFTPEQAANLAVRAELLRNLQALVRASARTQAEAARQCGLTQPRMNDLLRGRISRFSLDALVNIASALGQQVHLQLRAA